MVLDLEQTQRNLRERLLNQLTDSGHWQSNLASSALSTAVSVFALAQVDPVKYDREIKAGIGWLNDNANEDGGWGDTVKSTSNMSTTLLCWAALSVGESQANQKAQVWLRRYIGTLSPKGIACAVMKHYGKDRTFSAPILCMCALAGRLGENAWSLVPGLPFELVILPHRLFRWLRLQVVSYAMPALIAVGIARHRHLPSLNPIRRFVRNLVEKRAIEILAKIQPENGGFLEATPLTGFVTISLARCGYKDHRITSRAAVFLRDSMRKDGSWPIVTNLSTWVTSLAVDALGEGEIKEAQSIGRWLLSQQYQKEHPFTHAAGGGWAWTDLPGGVPDADDTSGALLALRKLTSSEASRKTALAGLTWLLQLQNSDGGMPTFCKGWGKLPFDRSSPELTAHALRAFAAWLNEAPYSLKPHILKAMRKGIGYLARTQRRDGSWVPLWFGNERALHFENPVVGTALVVRALHEIESTEIKPLRERGVRWLLTAQDDKGGWGGAPGIEPSIEETALALIALMPEKEASQAVSRGVAWLLKHTDNGQKLSAAPIGLYFASLWYFEEMYPLVFAVSALERVI